MLMVKSINLKEIPELLKLIEKGEELSDFRKLSIETILARWINYHLKN